MPKPRSTSMGRGKKKRTLRSTVGRVQRGPVKKRTATVGRSRGVPGRSKSGQLLRGFGRSDACVSVVKVAERSGGDTECVEGGAAILTDDSVASGGAAKGRRAMSVGGATCRALAAVGHEARAKILAKLLQGPAIYRALQKVTKLKAGPLYHHINQLRLAGLILPKQRDLYELTRGGRNLILVVSALQPLIRDRRRRPQ